MFEAFEATDKAIADAVAAQRVAGVLALVRTAKGETLYETARGVRDLSTGVAMTPDTVCNVFSMTKAITSVCALQQVEQGRIGLDDPLDALLPDLADRPVLEGFDAAGQPILRPKRGAITLRRLLTHTSGFVYDMWNEPMKRYIETAKPPSMRLRKLAALLLPLGFDPGERWDYGIGIDWAGRAVEELTGQTLGAYMAEHVFRPLGMTSSAFDPTPEQEARKARAHGRQADGSLKPFDLPAADAPEFEGGGGGLHCTIADYMRFCEAILAGGAPLLRPETMPLVRENQMGNLRVRPLQPAVPQLSNPAEFFPGLPKAWSAAFMLNLEDAPTGRSAGSMAWAGLGNCYHWIDPVKGVCGIILTQTLPFCDPDVLALFDRLERDTYAAIA
ncbi:MAG: beta-lactamase family protein [Alphaproteobacteria bacterium]|nr:beta-lactamase family protein [Alphaproteobacteria bacterium]